MVREVFDREDLVPRRFLSRLLLRLCAVRDFPDLDFAVRVLSVIGKCTMLLNMSVSRVSRADIAFTYSVILGLFQIVSLRRMFV